MSSKDRFSEEIWRYKVASWLGDEQELACSSDYNSLNRSFFSINMDTSFEKLSLNILY